MMEVLGKFSRNVADCIILGVLHIVESSSKVIPHEVSASVQTTITMLHSITCY